MEITLSVVREQGVALPEYATIAGPDGTVTEIAYYPEDRLFTVTLGEDMYTYDYDGKLVETRQEETDRKSVV